MKSTQRFFRAGVIVVMLVLVSCVTAAFAAQSVSIGPEGLQVVSRKGSYSPVAPSLLVQCLDNILDENGNGTSHPSPDSVKLDEFMYTLQPYLPEYELTDEEGNVIYGVDGKPLTYKIYTFSEYAKAYEASKVDWDKYNGEALNQWQKAYLDYKKLFEALEWVEQEGMNQYALDIKPEGISALVDYYNAYNKKYNPDTPVHSLLKSSNGAIAKHNCTEKSNTLDYFSFLGHKPATCTTDGTQSSWCTECGKYYDTVIPQTGHQTRTITLKAATCTEPGLQISYCANPWCNEVEEVGSIEKPLVTVIPAKGHRFGFESSANTGNPYDGMHVHWSKDNYAARCQGCGKWAMNPPKPAIEVGTGCPGCYGGQVTNTGSIPEGFYDADNWIGEPHSSVTRPAAANFALRPAAELDEFQKDNVPDEIDLPDDADAFDDTDEPEVKDESEVKDEVNDETKDEVNDETKDEVNDETKDEVNNGTKDEVNDETKDEVNDETKDEVNDETKDEVNDETKDEVNDETKDEVNDETKDEVNDETKDEVNDETNDETEAKENTEPALPTAASVLSTLRRGTANVIGYRAAAIQSALLTSDLSDGNDKYILKGTLTDDLKKLLDQYLADSLHVDGYTWSERTTGYYGDRQEAIDKAKRAGYVSDPDDERWLYGQNRRAGISNWKADCGWVFYKTDENGNVIEMANTSGASIEVDVISAGYTVTWYDAETGKVIAGKDPVARKVEFASEQKEAQVAVTDEDKKPFTANGVKYTLVEGDNRNVLDGTAKWGEVFELKLYCKGEKSTSKTEYKVTVEYQDVDGKKLKDPETVDTKDGGKYDVTNKKVDAIGEYTFKEVKDNSPLTGTTDKDFTIVLVYKKDSTPDQPTDPTVYTLTVNYLYKEDNSKAAEPHTETLAKDAKYDVSSPVISGYTADRAVVSGTMPAQNVTVTVYYTKNSTPTTPTGPSSSSDYTLTIHYVYEDGTTAASTFGPESHSSGYRYSVTSPAIEGYTPNIAVVECTMPSHNVEFTVVYKADEVDVPNPDVPLVDIPDEDVPLVEVPEVDPPLAELPEEVEIPDEDVPLADIPKTDDLSLLWHATALLSAAGLMVLAALDRKQRREK